MIAPMLSRTILIPLALVCAFAAWGQEHERPPADKTAGEFFKNVKVLREMPANELIPTMRVFSRSLGVRCDFCHVAKDFPSDEKHEKIAARHMIEMAGTINRDFFHGEREVTCWTCHRGSAKPESAAPAAAETGH